MPFDSSMVDAIDLYNVETGEAVKKARVEDPEKINRILATLRLGARDRQPACKSGRCGCGRKKKCRVRFWFIQMGNGGPTESSMAKQTPCRLF